MSKGTFQHINIVGNLGQDPEVRATQGGTSVANLSVAVSTYAGKDQQGQPVEHTEWFRCTVWGAQADNAGKYLSKGSKVLLTGEMRTRKWQDQNGQDRYSTELHAKDMQFMGGAPVASQGAQQAPAQQQYQQPPAQHNAPQGQAQGGDPWDDTNPPF